MASLSDLHPGQYVVVWYARNKQGQERLLLKHLTGPRWVLYTPDGQLLLEQLKGAAANGPARCMPLRGRVLRQEVPRPVYRFESTLTGQQLRPLLKRAEQLASRKGGDSGSN